MGALRDPGPEDPPSPNRDRVKGAFYIFSCLQLNYTIKCYNFIDHTKLNMV